MCVHPVIRSILPHELLRDLLLETCNVITFLFSPLGPCVFIPILSQTPKPAFGILTRRYMIFVEEEEPQNRKKKTRTQEKAIPCRYTFLVCRLREKIAFTRPYIDTGGI